MQRSGGGVVSCDINVNSRRPLIPTVSGNERQHMKRKEYSFDDLPNPGDAFQFRVSNDLYGVCRVIRRCTSEEMALYGCPIVLCAVSAWHGRQVPGPAEPALREIGTCTVINGAEEKKELQLLWIDTPPPPECAHLGTITPTAAEAEMECFAFGDWQIFFERK